MARISFLNIRHGSSIIKSKELLKKIIKQIFNFRGYIDFFLLDDLVSSDYKRVNFWLPFSGFESGKTIPNSFDEYELYKQNILKFLNKRNRRIKAYYNQIRVNLWYLSMKMIKNIL